MSVRFSTIKIAYERNKFAILKSRVSLASNMGQQEKSLPIGKQELRTMLACSNTENRLEGNSIWYNVRYNLKHVIKPKQFSNYNDLSDFLIGSLPKKKFVQKWIKLVKSQCHTIIPENRCQEEIFLNALGWKKSKSSSELKSETSGKKSKIQDFLEKGDVTVMHVKQTVEPFYLPPNVYKPGKDLSLLFTRFYEKVNNQKTLSSSTIYQGFCNLFIANKCSYHGYYIVHGKIDGQACVKTPPVKQGPYHEAPYHVLEPSSFIDFSKDGDDVFSSISEFYKTYFPTTIYNDWLIHLNTMKRDVGGCNFETSDWSNLLTSELEHYPTFLNQSDVTNYLKMSPSFYHRTCYWFLQNPIDAAWAKQHKIYGETHHVFPVYLKNRYGLPEIDQKFNYIYIPWFVHFFLHGLRFVEFQLVEDFKAAIIMYNKCIFATGGKDTNRFEELNKLSFTKIFNGLKIFVKNPHLQDKLFNDRQSRINAIKRVKPEIKSIYKNPMIWQNERYDIPDLFIEGGEVELHTDLAIILDVHLRKYLYDHPEVKKPSNWRIKQDIRADAKTLSSYLSQVDKPILGRQTSAFYGFTLQAFESKRQKSLLKTSTTKSRQHSTNEILNLIDRGGYEWINEMYNCQLAVAPHYYQTFPNLVYDLIIRLPDNARPKSWNHQVFGNPRIVEKFSAVVNHKQTHYLGWKLIER